MKDAKGHGSNGRGGAQARLAAARSNPDHPLGALTNAVSGAVARGTATPIAGIAADMNEPNNELGYLHETNMSAANALANGHPKSAPVPVHPYVSGSRRTPRGPGWA